MGSDHGAAKSSVVSPFLELFKVLIGVVIGVLANNRLQYLRPHGRFLAYDQNVF
jgi:hypothetical protein